MKYLKSLGIGVLIGFLPVVLLALLVYLSAGFACLVDFMNEIPGRKDKNYGSFSNM